MFGERYFATRQRLTDVVRGVRELGQKTGTEISNLSDEGDFLQGLRSPFLFVVCGEVNAGKSTLVNGLFGKELCKVNVLPETEKVHWYRWGKEAKTVNTTPTLEERYRPIDFLQDFNIVDTPGTNSVVPGHQPITERFLPVADLLLFVFPVSNPWGAATWQFIARLPQEQLQNVAFVLQQADLRSKEDLAVILEHMRTLAEQKTGARPEVFPVSGKMAMEAKKAQPFSANLWRKSGYPALEAFISKRVAENPERRRVLQDVRDSTQVALRRIEGKIETRTATLDNDQRFLRELENEVDGRREGQAKILSERLTGLGEVFLRQGTQAVDILASRMSISQSFISLFQQETLPTQIEKGLTEAVKEAVEETASQDGHELVKNCRTHWETVEPRIKENLQVRAPDFDKETESLAGTSERFVRRLGRSAKQAVAHLKLRGTLDMQMENRRAVLRRYMVAVLCALISAGVLGGLNLHPWPWIAVTIALLLLGAAAVYATKSRNALCQDFTERIEDLRQPFADSLADDYKDGVREFYVEYGGLFEIVRRRIADQKLLLKPQLERWNDLFLELKAIEQEI
jgi:GTPase SAR1 family protein